MQRVSDPQRPRPQFGEYATPEEQRNAIKVPLDDVESMPVESQESTSSHISVQGSRDSAAPAPAAGPSGDRIATMILLGVGLMTVVLSAAALTDLPTAIRTTFVQLDVGNYTTASLGSAMGWTALITQAALWITALWLSLRNLRKGRKAWWIPLVFGVVANIVMFGCIAIAMTGDPAFGEYVSRMS